jgi:phosphoenolpyruvate carboxykinase (ATP)
MLNLERLGLINFKNVYRNLPVAKLIEEAVKREEGVLVNNGAFNVYTGKYTGRSPNDKFIVDEPEVHEDIWWENNKPISVEKFEKLYNRLIAYLQNRDLFIFDGFVGADPQYRVSIRVITEYAYQSLMARQLFIRPTEKELQNFVPEYTLIAAPRFKAIPEIDGVNSEAFIILSFTKKLIIIGGTQYGGEIKKSIFTLMNYLMPKKVVLSMH